MGVQFSTSTDEYAKTMSPIFWFYIKASFTQFYHVLDYISFVTPAELLEMHMNNIFDSEVADKEADVEQFYKIVESSHFYSQM